jgi:hypothetical protein
MFNVGRNNPRVRDWLVEAMELPDAERAADGVSPMTPLLAGELVRRAPASIGKALVHQQRHRVGGGGAQARARGDETRADRPASNTPFTA